ncbi:MAG: hypothetical protein FWE37_00640 [Spirochaetaceae bacterium]|nr:hypothetical protein [Spirochaetaceae bacterium]
MTKKVLLTTLFFLFTLSRAGFTLSIHDLGYSSDDVQLLLAGNRLNNLVGSIDQLDYLPQTLFALNVRDILAQQHPRTLIEAAYFLPLRGASTLNLFNSLLNIESLSGLEFFSRGERRVKTLIHTVTVVDGPGGQPITIPSVTTVPSRLVLYFVQDDETFGVANYRATFLSHSNQLAITITNLQVLRQSIFRVADNESMHTTFIVVPINEGVLLYGLAINTRTAPFVVRNNMNESVLNRLDAFKNWFVSRYP